ncbi:MAG: DUF748 domain-containing protein, partial [Bdellovibrionota bacterium]
MKSKIMSLKRAPKWILIVVLAVVGIRAALPYVLKSYINDTLDGIPGYYGVIEDIDLSIWRGAYQIQGVRLVKLEGNEREPFFAADEIDISVDWRALLDRRLVSKISLFDPQLQFIVRPSKAASQTSVDSSWQDKVKGLVPFEINRFQIFEGLVRYKDETRSPKIDVDLHDLWLEAENITNATGRPDRLPSTLLASARVMKSGRLKLTSRMDLLSAPAQFDVNTTVDGLDLKEANEFTKAYGGFDFEKGTLRVTMEMAATKDKIDGYVKTLAKDVDVVDFNKELEKGDSPGHLLWEGIVGGVMALFKNHERDQFAARVPINGSRADLKIGT